MPSSKIKKSAKPVKNTSAASKPKPLAKKTAAPAKSKVAAKYRDPVSGKEWSGRGLAPKWLQGKNKADYLIA